MFFFFIEIPWFPFVHKADFSFMFNIPFEHKLPTIGLTTFPGQIALVVSITNSNIEAKIWFDITGLGLFWLSISYFIVSLDSNFHFAAITALPFAICTFIPFVGKPELSGHFVRRDVENLWFWHFNQDRAGSGYGFLAIFYRRVVV